MEHRGEESLNDGSGDLGLLAQVEAALQNQHVGDRDEDFCVAAIDLFLEHGVLLACAFDHLTETDELLSFIPWDKVGPAEAPCLLKSRNQMYELRIVGELRVHHFDILSIPIDEQVA